jgi:DNA primase
VYSSDTTKYLIHLHLEAEGVVEKPDVVGAIFGQTEGLLGEDLDLRDLQRTGRVGRIDVQISSKKGETRGEIFIASSLDRAETAILAASVETIDRVGPCVARVSVVSVEDIRVSKRKKIVERAKLLLIDSFEEGSIDSTEIIDSVRESLRIEKIGTIGEDRIPAGPNVLESDAIIVVEGRADVINLLRLGIKNAVAVEGTKISPTIIDLCEKKTSTAFFDGDRGGDLLLQELLQVTDIDYVAYAPRGKSVEDLTRKEIIKALRNKIPVEYVKEQEAEEVPEGGGEEAPRALVGRETEKDERDEKRRGLPKKKQDTGQKKQKTLGDHIDAVRGKRIARFLSSDLSVLKESGSEEVESVLSDLNGDVAGLVTDGGINQRILDLSAGKGIEYVAARDFKGIIKRPLTIRLIKIS